MKIVEADFRDEAGIHIPQRITENYTESTEINYSVDSVLNFVFLCVYLNTRGSQHLRKDYLPTMSSFTPRSKRAL